MDNNQGSQKGRHSNPPSNVAGSAQRGQHHTTVTVSTDPTPGSPVKVIKFDLRYFLTFPGILKVIQLIFGIICIACSAPAREYPKRLWAEDHNHWFLFVVVTSFLLTIIWSFCYLFQIKNFLRIDWMKIEFFSTIMVTLLQIIAFIVLLSGFGFCAGIKRCDKRITAGCFSIFNTIAYAIGAFMLFKHQKAKRQDQQ